MTRSTLGDIADIGATGPMGSNAQLFVWEVPMTAASLVGGRISGGSLNPARSLDPAVVSTRLESLWIHLAAPVLGV